MTIEFKRLVSTMAAAVLGSPQLALEALCILHFSFDYLEFRLPQYLVLCLKPNLSWLEKDEDLIVASEIALMASYITNLEIEFKPAFFRQIKAFWYCQAVAA
jgi:hypothetical protein